VIGGPTPRPPPQATVPVLPTAAKPHAYTALASWVRAQMLDALTTHELTVQDLAQKLGLHRATVRYHLTILLNQGLVEETKPAEHKGAGPPAGMDLEPPAAEELLLELRANEDRGCDHLEDEEERGDAREKPDDQGHAPQELEEREG